MSIDSSGPSTVHGTCAGCGRDLFDSASSYWCSESCQARWNADWCGVPAPDDTSPPDWLLSALAHTGMHRSA